MTILSRDQDAVIHGDDNNDSEDDDDSFQMLESRPDAFLGKNTKMVILILMVLLLSVGGKHDEHASATEKH